MTKTDQNHIRHLVFKTNSTWIINTQHRNQILHIDKFVHTYLWNQSLIQINDKPKSNYDSNSTYISWTRRAQIELLQHPTHQNWLLLTPILHQSKSQNTIRTTPIETFNTKQNHSTPMFSQYTNKPIFDSKYDTVLVSYLRPPPWPDPSVHGYDPIATENRHKSALRTRPFFRGGVLIRSNKGS